MRSIFLSNDFKGFLDGKKTSIMGQVIYFLSLNLILYLNFINYLTVNFSTLRPSSVITLTK